jgi:hypothetical protein
VDCQTLIAAAIPNTSSANINALVAVLQNFQFHAELYDLALILINRCEALATEVRIEGMQGSDNTEEDQGVRWISTGSIVKSFSLC